MVARVPSSRLIERTKPNTLAEPNTVANNAGIMLTF